MHGVVCKIVNRLRVASHNMSATHCNTLQLNKRLSPHATEKLFLFLYFLKNLLFVFLSVLFLATVCNSTMCTYIRVFAFCYQQSNVSVTWAEQLDSRLASVHTTGKMSWAATTRSIRECKIRIERIAPRYRFRGMGSRSNNMGTDVGGRSSHAKEHSRSKAS